MKPMPTDLETRLAASVDREEIRDLVRRERFARDQQHFDVMRDCFWNEAHIRSSWFDGNAVDYVESTRSRAGRYGNSKHWVFPGFLQIAGDRATVESPALIFNRIAMNGTEVDTQVWCRFFSRVLRRGDTWRLMSFEVLFERDLMRPVDPTLPLPIDWNVLGTYRPSYRFLTYVQESRGTRVNPDLYGDDRPDALAAFHAGEKGWLAGED
jgi:hypothetical protein